MTRVGLVLSGSGFKDGSEIQEAVIAMLALEEAGATVVCLAPDVELVTTRHLPDGDGAALPRRNVLEESARIARGQVRDLQAVSEHDFDAIVLPGGFGAALNLSTFATEGTGMTVEPGLERLLRAMYAAKKPIGAICIAPVIIAKLFGPSGVRLTIGTDRDTAAAVTALGAVHVDCEVTGCVTDEAQKIVTTPAYMLAESVKDIHQGIRRLAGEVVRFAKAADPVHVRGPGKGAERRVET